jgi:hypothetical protein
MRFRLTASTAKPGSQSPIFERVVAAAWAGMALSVALAACSARAPVTDLPPVCDAFLAKYEQCMTASLPTLPAVVKERAEQTRGALEKEVARARSLAPSTGADGNPTNSALAALEAKCNDNLQRVTASCASSRTH